jgi:uncharacterized membrane protein
MNSKRRISDREREVALHELEGFFERGFVDHSELADRKARAEAAKTASELKACVEDLQTARRNAGGLRVTDGDRDATLRRLEMHFAEGQLEPSEYERRRQLVERAATSAELHEGLIELPRLKPARERRDDRLASDIERARAVDSIKEAYAEGRLDSDEYEKRLKVVEHARTSEEISAAFRGIPQHRLGQSREVVKGVGRIAASAGVALARGMVIVCWMSACALILLAWQITGMRPALPIVLISLVSAVSVVLLWVPSLVPGRRRS